MRTLSAKEALLGLWLTYGAFCMMLLVEMLPLSQSVKKLGVPSIVALMIGATYYYARRGQ